MDLSISQVRHQGSSTLCVVMLEEDEPVLRTANLGDSAYMIIRVSASGKLETLFRSKEQQKSFNFPY